MPLAVQQGSRRLGGCASSGIAFQAAALPCSQTLTLAGAAKPWLQRSSSLYSQPSLPFPSLCLPPVPWVPAGCASALLACAEQLLLGRAVSLRSCPCQEPPPAPEPSPAQQRSNSPGSTFPSPSGLPPGVPGAPGEPAVKQPEASTEVSLPPLGRPTYFQKYHSSSQR